MNTLHKWLPLIAMERAGLHVLTIPMLKKQLTGKKDDAAVMFFDWHNKGGEMSFPTELKIIPLDNYRIAFHNWVGSKPSIEGDELKGAQMIMFETEGLPRFGREYRESKNVVDMNSLPLPTHLTVGDFKKKLAGLGEKAFFAVRHHGNNFVSPDLLMNYNTETYPLSDKKGNLYGAELKNGDIQTFGLDSTMSTDWGPFTFSLEPKTQKTLETPDTNEIAFLRNEVRKAIQEINEDIKVFHKGNIDTIPGEFQTGDRVMTFDLPKNSPYANREGTVVHSQTNDVRVKLDGMTDEYGEGFLPENLIRIPPVDAQKKFRILTPEEKKQMMFDALTMSEAGWMKKYPVGDYGDYKEMASRMLGNSGVDFSKINLNESKDVEGGLLK